MNHDRRRKPLQPRATSKGWDSHCHLNLDPLFERAEELLEEARDVAVGGCLIPSYGPREWPRQERLARLPNVANALGIHPWCLPDQDVHELLEELDEAFSTLPRSWGDKLRAVGEFGLDRSSPKFEACFKAQQAVFTRHLEWAELLHLPVIIHVVARCHGAAQKLLQRCPPKRGGVVHSFPGPKELIPAYARFGLYFSYSGNLLRSEKVRESLRETPLDRILFETDGPEGPPIGPAPLSPASLPAVVKVAAEVLGRSEETCWQLHRENCARLFGPFPP